MEKALKIIDKATTISCAALGMLAMTHATYELIATGVLYCHIYAIGAGLLAVAGAARKEAQNG